MSARKLFHKRLGFDRLESRVVCNAAMGPGLPPSMQASFGPAMFRPEHGHEPERLVQPFAQQQFHDVEPLQMTWTVTVVVTIVPKAPAVPVEVEGPPVFAVTIPAAKTTQVRSTARTEAIESSTLQAPAAANNAVAALSEVARTRVGDVAPTFAALSVDRATFSPPANFRFSTSDEGLRHNAPSATPTFDQPAAPSSQPLAPRETPSNVGDPSSNEAPRSNASALADLLIDGVQAASQLIDHTARALEDSARAIASGHFGAWTWLALSSWALAAAVAAESAIQSRVRPALARLTRKTFTSEDDGHDG